MTLDDKLAELMAAPLLTDDERVMKLCVAGFAGVILHRLTQPEDVPTIDLGQEFWKQIQEAAKDSPWMPPEYMQNDWVADVCAFLRGHLPQKD